ncbi:hypothetical protein SAMN05443582_10948 [Phyllobacterium sp. OV277]|nr:hypothetical protein SAMN05443582_10948 [Phyllobacterium sp. OV277]
MRSGFAIITPLCPVGHLPHKGGDHIGMNAFAQPETFQIVQRQYCRLISPLVGEMPDKAEGGGH